MLFFLPEKRLFVSSKYVEVVVDDTSRVSVPLGRDVSRGDRFAPRPSLGVKDVDNVAGEFVVAAAKEVHQGAVRADGVAIALVRPGIPRAYIQRVSSSFT